MNSLPQVSIGMPVYNGESFIREALDSLLAQTFTNFELIISDNASTDQTENICKEYAEKDSRIRYVRQKENKGGAFNASFVLNEATGEYFMWAAHDDRWDSDWISSILEKIIKEDNIVGFGKIMHIDINSKPIDTLINKKKLNFTGEKNTRKLKYYLTYAGSGKINLFYSIFPKSILLQFNLASYDWDYVFLYDLLNSLSFQSVSDSLIYKRIHGKAASALLGSNPGKNFFSRVFFFSKRIYVICRHYIVIEESKLKFILTFLIPAKIAIAMYHRASVYLKYKK